VTGVGERPDEVTIPLRWVDADAYGHVHHAAFLSLIEHARIVWLLRVLGSQAAIWDHATVKLTIDYRRELLVQHREVVCGFGVARVGRSSIELVERMDAPRGRRVADLRTVIVAWRPAEHGTRPLDEKERQVLLDSAGSA
jgi:acyl-CoA thioester hydrolase